MASPETWSDGFQRVYRELMSRGLYAQAARLQQEVIASASTTAAIGVVRLYEELLGMWRDSSWLDNAARIATELHMAGLADQAQQMMQSISNAFSQGDAETILQQYIRLLDGERRGRAA